MKPIAEIAGNTFYPLTIGSYPAFPVSKSGSTRAKKATAVEAIEVQARYGIHFPSTGEVASVNLDSMELPFFEAFDGLRIEGKSAEVVSDLKVKSEDRLKELEVVKDIETAKLAIDLLVQAGGYPDFRGLKASISGPGYLAQKTTRKTSLPIQVLMGKFAAGLVEVAYCMYQAGARVIQIDEPLITRTDPKRETIQALQSLFSQLRLRLPEVLFLSLHTCGPHTPETVELLEDLDVDVLDIETTRYEENFSLFSNEWLTTSSGKNIGVGVVDGLDAYVEEETKVMMSVRRICTQFDRDIVMLKPDCALRKLTPETAARKLERVKFAREKALECS